jgi:hypothetical protein
MEGNVCEYSGGSETRRAGAQALQETTLSETQVCLYSITPFHFFVSFISFSFLFFSFLIFPAVCVS